MLFFLTWTKDFLLEKKSNIVDFFVDDDETFC